MKYFVLMMSVIEKIDLISTEHTHILFVFFFYLIIKIINPNYICARKILIILKQGITLLCQPIVFTVRRNSLKY